jgi:hypothetical protein
MTKKKEKEALPTPAQTPHPKHQTPNAKPKTLNAKRQTLQTLVHFKNTATAETVVNKNNLSPWIGF